MPRALLANSRSGMGWQPNIHPSLDSWPILGASSAALKAVLVGTAVRNSKVLQRGPRVATSENRLLRSGIPFVSLKGTAAQAQSLGTYAVDGEFESLDESEGR